LNIHFFNELVFEPIKISNIGQASQPEVLTVFYALRLGNLETRIFLIPITIRIFFFNELTEFKVCQAKQKGKLGFLSNHDEFDSRMI